MNIYIVTGAIHSGKTTKLIEFCKSNPKAAGILSPVIDGKRHFMDIRKMEPFPMEAMEGEKDVLPVGKYIFSLAAFKRAEKILSNCFSNKDALIVIDEIGPLELREKGFAEILRKSLALPLLNTKLLLVVRENIIDDVIEYFDLSGKKSTVINIDQLSLLLNN